MDSPEIRPKGGVFALRTAEGQRGVGAPTLPRPTQDQALTDALTEGVIRERKIDEQAKREKRRLPLKVKVGLAVSSALALVGGGTALGIKAFDDNERTPASRDINSIGPTSFTDNGLVPRAESSPAETKKVNPEEVFDPYAERQVITLKNIVFMSPEEYKDIVPPTIDPKHPERVNVFFPIRFAEGSGERKIVIEKRVQRGSISGGNRIISNRENNGTSNYEKFPVKSTYVIKEGLIPGDELIPPAGGLIARPNNELDKDGLFKPAGFRILGGNENSDHYRIRFGGISALRLTADIPADTSESATVNVGGKEFKGSRIVEHPILVKEIEVLGTVVKAGIDPVRNQTDGQFEITVLSAVTVEDGKIQGGPAEIIFNTTPDGKLIIPKK